MHHKLGSLATILIGVLAWAGTSRAWAQGNTAPRTTRISSGSTAVLAAQLRCAGHPDAAAQMTSDPPAMGVFTGPIPPKDKAQSGYDKQGRFVVVIPPGLTVGDAAGRILHELAHRARNDTPIPKHPTAEQAQAAACVEAQAQCDALGDMAAAADDDCPYPCSVVNSMQGDAMNYAQGCQLGVGVSGPPVEPPCPDATSGSVPCAE